VKDTNTLGLRKLPPNERWLVATHLGEAKVGSGGIKLKIRGKLWSYANGDLRRFFGTRVLYFLNIENHALITVCDPKRKEFISVEGTELPANGATKDEIRAVKQRIAAFNALPKMVADLINHPVVNIIARDGQTGPVSQELGKSLEKAEKEHTRKKLAAAAVDAVRDEEGKRLMREALMEEEQASRGANAQ
jgi:hypothetical protein